MSQYIREWKRSSAEKKHIQAEARTDARRQAKLLEMATTIKQALERSKNKGVIFADTHNLLLLILALEIQHGPGAKSLDQHMQEYREFYAGKEDSRTGRRKLVQGDNQSLMRDAVKMAISQGFVLEHKDRDSEMVALYLPTNQASTWSEPKWTVFFAEAGHVVENYIPTQRILDAYADDDWEDTYYREREYIPTGRVLALYRRWGELSSH
jgi:hypothetical protein